MSKICLVLTGNTIDENLGIIERNRSLIDMVELRTDLLNENQFDGISTFPSLVDVPVILTCRKVIDGGKWLDNESGRIANLLNWIDGGFDYIDLEIDFENKLLEEKVEMKGIQLIRSFHDFNRVPQDLLNKMTSQIFKSNVIIKGAVYPKSSEELYHLVKVALTLKDKSENPFILLGMGEFGFPTRILAEKLGSYLTFCSDSAGISGAPGHCSAADLNKIYRFRQIDRDTVVNSIIGNPLKQSRSPQIHNKGYERNRINAVYVPFFCDSPHWFLKTADLLKIKGSSVTIPFKSDIIPMVHSKDKAVEKIGASNTIYRDPDNKWTATNTDTYGLIKPLLDFLGRDDFTGEKVAVIGAGGAARAAVFALQEKGARVAIFNRTVERADELAYLFNCKAYSLDKSSESYLKEYRSIIVQTTNAGMAPLEHINPLEFYEFTGDETVYDIIYKPRVTLLLDKADKAGCRTLGGYKMLEEQAYIQFKLFTGKEYN